MRRRYDVDWLRVFATYLLLVFHVGKVFDVPPFYHIKNGALSDGLGFLTGFIHQWHMPLFFLLAGWSAYGSLSTRGAGTFLRERVGRILIPFIAGCVLLCPFLKYIELLAGMQMTITGGIAHAPFHESFFEFLPTFFTRLDRFTWAHLWFLIYLFVFTLLYLPLLIRLTRTPPRPTRPSLALVYAPIVPLALIQVALRGRWPGFQNLYDDWANFSYYSLHFILGFLLARSPAWERTVQREWKRAGLIGLGALALMIPETSPFVNRALSAVAGWSCVVALLGMASHFLAFSNAALRYLSESALPVYILHQLGIVLIGYFVIQLPAGIGFKFVLLLVMAVLATMAVYHVVVRRVPLLRLLFGMKGRPAHRLHGVGARWADALPLILCALAAALLRAAPVAADSAGEWPAYGRDAGGARHSPLAQITRANVARLAVAWTYHSGDVPTKDQHASFEATPILVDGTLYLSTPFNRVIALDPDTGTERWRYDPHIDLSVHYSDFTSRGVSTWLDPQRGFGEPCRRRVYEGTNDARLIALDAATGKPCADFGAGGQVDLKRGVGQPRPWEYGVSSPPAIVHDLVVIGSKVADNQRIDAPSGVVRAFDARTGMLRWSWEALPPDTPQAPPAAGGAKFHAGTANAWAVMSADEERDLLCVPTGNTAPDYFGGQRNGSDFYSSSVVALRASTGAMVWHFQTVHHDVWDYDVPAQPALITVRRDGAEIAAVAQSTKVGHLFFLNRETGAPLFPVEERAVPQTTVPGEQTARTQPFPTAPPPLEPEQLTADNAWGLTPWDRGACRKRIAALRSEGIFTPPSVEGTLVIPGNVGGSNWSGVAFEPERGLLIVNTNNVPVSMRLAPRDQYDAASKTLASGWELAPQTGTPFGMMRGPLLSPLGLPCVPPPWGKLAAVDTATGRIRWAVPLGTTRDMLPLPIAIRVGTPNLGGAITTAGGLVFIGAAMDNYLRAFDLDTGEELWKGRLPAGGQATPMTYQLRDGGKQYVVIAAGGHGRLGTKLGDAVVAYALP